MQPSLADETPFLPTNPESTPKLIEANMVCDIVKSAVDSAVSQALSAHVARNNIPLSAPPQLHFKHIETLMATTEWGMRKLPVDANAHEVYRYFDAVTRVLRLSNFIKPKVFSVMDFVEGKFDSTVYDAPVWTILETICQYTLPDPLKKSSPLASVNGIRQRAGFDQRLQRVLLLQDLREAASKQTGFERIHSFERIAKYARDLEISVVEMLTLDLLEPAPDSMWDTIKRDHSQEHLSIDLVMSLANRDNMGIGTPVEWKTPRGSLESPANAHQRTGEPSACPES